VIVLDTNVLSEPLKPAPHERVIAWLDSQAKESLYLCAPVLMEVLLGIAQLPRGKRKDDLATAVQRLLANYFAERFLAFEREAATAYALLASRAAAHGYTISVGDAQIAAIAAVHGCSVATRDLAPFQAAGVSVVNPWKS
jgi:hypothetical protein